MVALAQDAVEYGGRPALRIADIVRHHAEAFADEHVLTPDQHKVLRALSTCRTAALGGHVDVCDQCGFERPAYNSCRNRHCPGCQAGAAHTWLDQRLVRVLPVHHFHVVFTLPKELRPLAQRNGSVVFAILLRTAAEVLDTLAQQRLGAQLGVTTILHTWTRAMLFHPHVHCVVTGGGLDLDGSRWVPTSRRYLFPVAVLRKLFRRRVRQRLREAFDAGKLDFGGACARLADVRAFRRLLRSIHRKRWVVYSKPPFAGTDQVFAYLGRYTHRVAISDHRLVSATDDAVTFRTRHDQRVTVAPHEFIRRFLLHVLPRGFHKIRHTGLYAGTNVRTRLARARAILGDPSPEIDPALVALGADDPVDEPCGDLAPRICPCCGAGTLVRLPLSFATSQDAPQPAWEDSS